MHASFTKWECLAGNAVLPGIIAEACDSANVPWGHVSSGCIYTGSRPDGSGLPRRMSPILRFVRTTARFTAEAKALGEEVARQLPECLHLAGPDTVRPIRTPRNYLTKVMRYARLLDATNSISELQEFVEASLLCWELRVPFGIYNMTNPGTVTTREVVDLSQKGWRVRPRVQLLWQRG